MIKVGVIGSGSFGEKRAAAVKACTNGELTGVADADVNKAEAASRKLAVRHYSVDGLFEDKEIDVIIVCLPNKYHAPVTIRALKAGKHVLCEKPLARTTEEAYQMVKTAEETGKLLKTGSNHRYFESVRRAYEIAKSGDIGEVISFNGRIGHNGERLKNTWFWDKDISGGGTLLDNGCHLLDIARWFLGDFVEASGLFSNLYWKDCPVEDTASGVFLTGKGKIATINSSWRQLAGYFHFEVNGTHGYITVDGRFDTHGGDNVYWQSLKGKGEIHSINYGHVKPNSYVLELEEFFDDIGKGIEPKPSGRDGLEVIKMIESIYKSNNHKVKI
ncbi:MAG: Gfo/Idh/MocA family oxidoreductase [Thermodesulfovibrionales bacterium]